MSRARSRRVSLAALVVLVVAAAGALALWYRSVADAAATAGSGPASTTASSPSGPASGGGGGAGGASGAPGAPGTGAAPTEGTTASPTDFAPSAAVPDVPAPVTVTVTYWQWDPSLEAVVAGGYVGAAIEAEGTCTLELSRDRAVRTGRTQAEADAITTSCGEIRVDGGELSPGSWTGVLRYASDRSVAVSAEFTVVVL